MKKLFLVVIMCVPFIGCGRFSSVEPEFRSACAVGLGFTVVEHNEQPDAKYKRKDCPVCKGKGQYLSGDGISLVNCGYCEPDGKSAEQVKIEELEQALELAEKRHITDIKSTELSNILTAIIVNVPHDAKVYMGSRETLTHQTGACRTFFSANLRKSWKDYKIVAEYKGVKQTKTVDVSPGMNVSVTFDFGDSSATERIPIEEIVAAETPEKKSKCCPDCSCGDNCTCSYPGECLVIKNSGQDVTIYELVEQCNGRKQCIKVQVPVRKYSAGKQMQVLK